MGIIMDFWGIMVCEKVVDEKTGNLMTRTGLSE